MAWTLDPPLGVMKQQILSETTLDASEIGTIGDAAHQGTNSAHNPESPPPPGNPDGEVDALDCPHKPADGADMFVMTESLRLAHKAGRDRRLRLVIFHGRQWSEYAKDGYGPYEWRPYRGENQHDEHAHCERNDKYRDDLRPFETGLGGMNQQQQSWTVAGSLADNPDTGKPYNVLHARLRLIMDATDPDVVKMWQRAGWGPLPEHGLKQVGDMLRGLVESGVTGTIELDDEQMEALAQRVAAIVGPVLLDGLVQQLSALVFQAALPAPSARAQG